ncbi:MAG: hypothetical protein EKK53_22380 [Burkholderiales bacterium]|nr:MAG: hypothetical protein EKK53_22380 [Burkholderiales bacterium]
MARSTAPSTSPGEGPAKAPRWLKVAIFLLLYAVYQWGYQGLRDSRFDDWFIHTLTVVPASSLIDLIFPAAAVQPVNDKLIWPDGSLTLRAGCDGFEVIGIFIAAVLSTDVGWRRGLLALLAGCLAIWMLNQIRIAVLFAVLQRDRGWFDLVHTVLGPLGLIAAVAAIYVWMVRRPPEPLMS